MACPTPPPLGKLHTINGQQVLMLTPALRSTNSLRGQGRRGIELQALSVAQKVALLDRWHQVKANTSMVAFARGHHINIRSMWRYLATEQKLRNQVIEHANEKRVGYKGHGLKYPELDQQLFIYLAIF